MIKLSILYFLFYSALGSSIIYFANLFDSIGMGGKILGIVFALGSLLAIIWQPFIGFIADKSRKVKEILALSMFIMAAALIALYFRQDILATSAVYLIYSLCIWGVMPLIDSVTVSFDYPFGKIRLWGAIGFAVGSFIGGKAISVWGVPSFLLLAGGLAALTGGIFMTLENIEVKEGEKANFSDIKSLLENRKYLLFIFFTIMILGGVNSHSSFFSLYFQKIGGGIALFGGIVFLLVLSEVPFMGIAPKFIEKYGTEIPLITAGIMYCVRWGVYYFFPYPGIIAATFFLQGASIGLFFGVAAAHIKNIVDRRTISTAMTTFMAAGTFGGMMLQLLSGIAIDRFGILSIYFLFMILSIIGTAVFAFKRKK